ncbi:alpha/beta hydrolase [Lysinibacillus sp. SGAir0095]|uniref:alpha/beta hydrolase n=1 Tax=Lysinibacillus sp. SGAir0095 TaxID=2070463 RepID=UPI0010CCB5DA|nr:alpha/beta hydrolase [Lysinibacillus sp. SGAir0095]QCR32563.1 alpha/beta hydrolase [Lysinibacillus sp. SGAir0095]
MPLHHYIEQFFQQNLEARSKGVPLEIPPLEKRPKVLNVEERVVEGDTHQIPIRIYTPDDKVAIYPLLVFFHGGGFIDGSIESHDVSCRLLCQLSGYKVISVGYRFSSEHIAPAAFQDCYNVTKWTVEHASELGGDKENVVVGGASAGGNLATVVALKSIATNDFKLAKQVLHYPILDIDITKDGSIYQSRALYNAKYGVDITTSSADLLGYEQAGTPYTSPLSVDTETLSQMPKTLIFTAEYDPLCDEGELYAEKLKDAGTAVKLVRFDGGIHGFMQNFPGSPDYMRGYDITSEFLISD